MALPYHVNIEIDYNGTEKTAAAEETQKNSAAAAGGSAEACSYTVAAGDTLWAIAKKFYGKGKEYRKIYEANAEIIEVAAREHGMSNSNGGHWIWPGETLIIPGIIATETASGKLTPDTTNQGQSPQDLGSSIAKKIESFTYTDPASGESDSVSITVSNIEKEWLGSLMPKRGASLGAKIKITGKENSEDETIFDCGTFTLDDISFSGRPLICELGGVSVPAMTDFKTLPRTRTWKKTTIREIASQISTAAGVALYYEADTIQIAEIEQNDETDSAFLYSLCEKYGLAMKVYNSKIIIFDIVIYEEKNEVSTIHETDMLSGWSYNTTVDGTYTGVKLSYTDPDNDKTISVTLGEEGRMYAVTAQASSRYDAELQAAAKLNAANRAIETMDVSIQGNAQIVAGQCVMIAGLGNADGKYYVDKAVHSIGSGYTTQLTLHKVQTPIKMTKAAASANKAGQKYTVISGDTLWAISKKFYGTGTKHGIIYEANSGLIEDTAKAHGKPNSENGHWIYPGTILTIPED